jgi:hypothetical protein
VTTNFMLAQTNIPIHRPLDIRDVRTSTDTVPNTEAQVAEQDLGHLWWTQLWRQVCLHSLLHPSSLGWHGRPQRCWQYNARSQGCWVWFTRAIGPRPSLVDVQVQPLTLPTSSLALLGTTAHWLIAQFGASGGGWVLVQATCFECSQYGSFFKTFF